jgi:hypothetical protein
LATPLHERFVSKFKTTAKANENPVLCAVDFPGLTGLAEGTGFRRDGRQDAYQKEAAKPSRDGGA